MRKIIAFILLLASPMESSFADAPILDPVWQWNKNIKIDFIYAYWQSDGGLIVRMDNGQFCSAPGGDKTVISTILAMRASGASGEIVCTSALDPVSPSVDGYPLRKIHRVKF